MEAMRDWLKQDSAGNLCALVDNTILQSFSTCPAKAVLQYGLDRGPKETPTALKLGGAVASSLEAYRRGVNVDEAMAVFEEEYKEWAEKHVKADDKRGWANVSGILREAYRRREETPPPYTVVPELVERSLVVPMMQTQLPSGEPVRVCYVSKPDMIAVFEGRPAPVDTKTSSRINSDWAHQWRSSSQLIGYVWAAARLWPGETAPHAFVDGIEIVKVPGSTKKCGTHGVKFEECGYLHPTTTTVGPIEFSEAVVLDWYNTARGMAQAWINHMANVSGEVEKALRTSPVLGRFNGACNSYNRQCEYTDFCAQGRPVAMLEHATAERERVWSPGVDEEREIITPQNAAEFAQHWAGGDSAAKEAASSVPVL